MNILDLESLEQAIDLIIHPDLIASNARRETTRDHVSIYIYLKCDYKFMLGIKMPIYEYSSYHDIVDKYKIIETHLLQIKDLITNPLYRAVNG